MKLILKKTQIPRKISDLTLKQARHSVQSLLPPKFLYMPLECIGVHEKPNNLHTNQLVAVLTSLLKRGYRGSAISVFEFGNDTIYRSLEQNTISIFDNLQYGRVGIADGHNRLAALRILESLGLLSLKYIPVQIIPGRDPEVISIRVCKNGEVPLTIDVIENCFTDRGVFIDPKSTSHFEVYFSDGMWRRVREGQPDIFIDRGTLIDLEKLHTLRKHLVIGSKTTLMLASYSVGIDDLQKVFTL